MGANQSAPAEQTAESSSATPAEQGTQLYKFVQTSAGGTWERYAAQTSFEFVDVNDAEEGSTKARRWHIQAGELDAEVTDQFVCELGQQRVIIGNGSDAWALRFPAAAACQAFADRYNECLFENTYGQAYSSEEKHKVFADSLIGRGPETAESREQWQQDVDMPDAPRDADRVRRHSAVGQAGRETFGVRMGAGANSYLVRDKQIEVLKNVHGGVRESGLSFNVTPPRGSQAFTPSKLMLMHGERRMNMLSPEKGDRLFHTDIETGKVVSEWGLQKGGVDRGMVDISNDTRGAQMDDRDTFLGIGAKTLNRWDMRAPSGIVQDMASPSVMKWQAGHDYATNVKFSCMATSGDGYVVIGSEDGQVRLFSETDKALSRAKTSIPGLGAPITAVDVTYDGKWALATTKSYLMVIKTSFKDKAGKEANGFKARMGAAAPAPRLLRLKPEDMALVKGAPLRTGRFTWVTEAGRQERWIVASCGNYTVLWNFRTVKLTEPTLTSYGGLTTCTEYHLSQKPESVVDSVFMHDNYAPSPNANENSMVVVTKHQVYSLADDDDDNV